MKMIQKTSKTSDTQHLKNKYLVSFQHSETISLEL